jgi:hypothetical protein
MSIFSTRTGGAVRLPVPQLALPGGKSLAQASNGRGIDAVGRESGVTDLAERSQHLSEHRAIESRIGGLGQFEEPLGRIASADKRGVDVEEVSRECATYRVPPSCC